MKFSEMPYERPEFEPVNAKLRELLQRFKDAKDAEECFAAYLEYDRYSKHIGSMFSLANIRNTIDTRDEFYDAEKEYANETRPKLMAAEQEFTTALLSSTFRKDMEKKWGKLMFTNAEINLKVFKPEIIPDLQEENKLSSEYEKLCASAQIDFDGKKLTLTQMRTYNTSLDREVRKAASSAVAGWYMENSDALDTIYDKLVKVRDGIAKKLGFKNFVEVGYCRMRRNCYDAEMVKKFREGVVEHIVPVVTRLKAEQAKRIGAEAESLKIYDSTFEYPDGNARPQGTPDDIFAHGRTMYHELSPETAEFIDFMMENELFDVLSKPGKAVGGYCATIDDHKSPFIFANFNGTAGDIDVLTHEAGHALASFQSRDMEPAALKRYTSETAEVHSMSMEFFTWPWMEGFFGPQAEKYYLSHLAGGLTFLPYGSMVDEFQHHVYERPEMSPKERNDVWLSLEHKYRPWLDIAGFPYYGDGRVWQGQMHIYRIPFYYIDYCLARTISLCFWALSQKDKKQSWDKYMRLIGFAGTKTFLDLVTDAGMPTPFDGETLKQLAGSVVEWLDGRKK